MFDRTEKAVKTIMVLAIFKMPFMHKLTKSMAENTYLRSNGKNIIKTKIDQNTSNTLKQQIQRLKMKYMNRIRKAFAAVMRIGFPEAPADYSGWNAFVHANVGSVAVNEAMEASLTPELLIVAQGSLEVVEEVGVSMDEAAHTLTFQLGAIDLPYGSLETDRVFAVVWEQARMRSRIAELGTRVSQEAVDVPLPAQWDMQQLAVYVFALSEDGRKASDSTYVPIS